MQNHWVAPLSGLSQVTRRGCIKTVATAVAAPALYGIKAGADGIPGPFPGKVVAVENKRCLKDDEYRLEPIRQMVEHGMRELTGAATPAEAWQRFFSPGDIVGIKWSPVGRPYCCSSREMLHSIVGGLQSAGVRLGDIIVYERYRDVLEQAGIPSWLPEGVGWQFASPCYTSAQQDADNYDLRHFIELPFTAPDVDPAGIHARRSYVARFVSGVDKIINVPCLKTHYMAGVTLALKNLSHGLVNNVSRSHDPGPALRYNEFIPAVVGSPLIRSKTVLHILDGARAVCHGGPGIPGSIAEKYVWEHKTVYFATDPVALDRIGMTVLDEKRARLRLHPIANSPQDAAWPRPLRQPEYIEAAGRAGLGESNLSRITLRPVKL